jgi:hypothetical protein
LPEVNCSNRRVTRNCGPICRSVLLAICLLTAACASKREPARTLIDEIDLTIAGSAEDAAKYAPAELQQVRGELDALKRGFDRGDYAGVLAQGPGVLSAAGDLIGTAAAAKIDRTRALAGEWSALAQSQPDRISALEKRIDRLASRDGGKRPRGKPGASASSDARGDAAAARAALGEIYALWSKARSAFASRNVEEAVQTANVVKTKIDALSDTLPASGP